IGNPAIAIGIVAPEMLVRVNSHATLSITLGKNPGTTCSAKAQEPAVHRIVAPGNEFCLLGTKKQRQRCHFTRVPHSSDGLGAVKLFEHFVFASGIVLVDEAFDKGSAHAGGRDAVTSDVIAKIIPGDRISHGHDG